VPTHYLTTTCVQFVLYHTLLSVLSLKLGKGGSTGRRRVVASNVAADGDLAQLEAAIDLDAKDGAGDDIAHVQLTRVG